MRCIYGIKTSPHDLLSFFGKSLMWVKLSNSGDSLKLLIPSCSRKIISGWTNYSCMVTIRRFLEKVIGYRGSKSDFKLISVKEQRVDGSWYIKSMYLRYTLMGFERNYQVKIPSNQINKASYSTLIPSLRWTLGFNRVFRRWGLFLYFNSTQC
jgi:hypothetical protein